MSSLKENRSEILKPFPRTRSGWGDYTDSQYTEQSPFVLPANQLTMLPNDGLFGPKSQRPESKILVENSRILGRENESLLLTIDFKTKSTSLGFAKLVYHIDIGGDVDPLYMKTHYLFGGIGEMTPISDTIFAYSLDTWQANGGAVMCLADVETHIYDIRFIVGRLHVPD